MRLRKWMWLGTAAILMICLRGIVLTAYGNWNALLVLKDVLPKNDTNLPEWRYRLPIQNLLVYVPRAVQSGDSTVDSMVEWNRELESGVAGDRKQVTERQPAYQVKASTVGWSLLGYDVVNQQTIRLYWQSPRQYTHAPLLRESHTGYTLLVGERLYREVRLDRQLATEAIIEPSSFSSVSCPTRRSTIGNWLLWESLRQRFSSARGAGLHMSGRNSAGSGLFYAVAARVGQKLCYFAVVWPDKPHFQRSGSARVVSENREGAWVVISTSLPPLPHKLPAWDFASEQVTRGWSSINNQTFVRISPAGLAVTATGTDPSIASPSIRLDAHEAPRLRVKVRAQSGNTIELFWSTLARPRFDQHMSVSQRLYADGLWHVYEFDLSSLAEWRGIITRLRLDPTNSAGLVDIAFIKVK